MADSSKNIDSIRIFNTGDEGISLLMGPLFVVVCGLADAAQLHLNTAERTLAYVFTYVICMNTVHVGLTFGLLLKLPAFRSYLTQQSSVFMKAKFLVPLSLFLTLITFVMSSRAIDKGGWVAMHVLWLPAFILQIPLDFWGGWHTRRQTMGLTLLYNRLASAEVAPEEKKFFLKQNRLEKLAFAGLSFGLFFRLFISPFSKITWVHLLSRGSLAIEFGLCFWLIWLAWRTLGPARKNKTIFQLRSFLFPLSALNYFCVLGVLAMHGIEYFFLTRKMLVRSEIGTSRAQRALFLGLIIGGCLVIPKFAFDSMHGLSTMLFGEHIPMWPILLLGISKACTLLHYHIDGFIFRFQDPTVREHVAPLMLNAPMVESIHHDKAA